MSNPVSFSIIGGAGFRAQYYLRIASALPEHFRIAGMVVRDEEKGIELERTLNVSTYRTLEELLDKEQPDFVVVSVSKSVIPLYLMQLAERKIPMLAETPPAETVEDLVLLHERLTDLGAKIQVAEQYHLHPIQAARLEVIKSGRLGNISEATVSISHMYHGVSLIRKMLGVGFEEARIKAISFDVPISAGPDRSGPPTREEIVTVKRNLAWIEFDGKLGIYDFTDNQHRSWIRSNHLSVRGEKGEIFDNRLDLMFDYATPLHLEFKRINKGEEENQEGHYLQGIMVGERWVYQNPFIPARLYDDEIAIATCLKKMALYIKGGPEFYSLEEASQDQYLGLMIEQAIQTGKSVQTVRQPWG
ncbi:Gfo/Idh/MocA family protein [Bacillus solitudinis]|uniref:Gfo/Idh/MocA family protein n=1 Tax=Bacillus solitudinis TaxID=2014074 RepID=UPI000C239F32|nr:Gfo/Idh/MocA family oxidoreductase [Bacillus solitudinis]